MNPIHSGGPNEDFCDPVALNLAASKLDIYRHERLAYTEIPVCHPAAKPIYSRIKTLLTAICRCVIARF